MDKFEVNNEWKLDKLEINNNVLPPLLVHGFVVPEQPNPRRVFTESLIVSCPPGEVPEEGGELEEGNNGEETKCCHHPQVPVDPHCGA